MDKEMAIFPVFLPRKSHEQRSLMGESEDGKSQDRPELPSTAQYY